MERVYRLNYVSKFQVLNIRLGCCKLGYCVNYTFRESHPDDVCLKRDQGFAELHVEPEITGPQPKKYVQKLEPRTHFGQAINMLVNKAHYRSS